MGDAATSESLLRQLDAQRDAYLHTLLRLHDLLREPSNAKSVATQLPPQPELPKSPRQSVARHLSEHELLIRKFSNGRSALHPSSESKLTGDESDDEVEEGDYFVQDILEAQTHDHGDLRKHLHDYRWDDHGTKILKTVVDNPAQLRAETLFPTRPGPTKDRSHHSHYQVFDIGSDGAPVTVDTTEVEKNTSRAMAVSSCPNAHRPLTDAVFRCGTLSRTLMLPPRKAKRWAVSPLHESLLQYYLAPATL